MSRPRLTPSAFAAGGVWALGAWCAAGVLTTTGIGRIGVLPPLWVLAVLVSIGVAVAVSAGRERSSTLSLWLPAVSLLPWGPWPIPAVLLLWVGPPGVVLAAVALLGVIIAAHGGLFDARRRAIGITTAAALVAAIYAGAAWWLAPVIPGGDEPHYLIITQSLLHDGDLRIEDNHQRREYAAYVNGEIRPDYLRRGTDRQIYSIHAPGLPALVLPAFAIGGYPGVVVFLSVLSALGTIAVWRAAWLVTGNRGAAWLAWAATALSVPYFFQAFTVYPDGPAAAIVAGVAALGLARRGTPGMRACLAIGTSIAVLPWLHTRYAAIAAPLAIVILGRLWWADDDPIPANTRLGRTAAFITLPVVSVAAWLLLTHSIYGIWDPRAPYGGAAGLVLTRIPHGLAGLFLDQQFGLLPHAPIYLLGLLGAISLWRTRARLVGETAIVVLPYVIAVAGFHMWWGGHSSPARFLVPVLLPLGMGIAAWWADARSRASRTVAIVLLAWSIGMTLVLLARRGALLYNSRDGYALWLLEASDNIRLAGALPSLFQGGPGQALAVASVWLLAGAALWYVLARAEARAKALGTWCALVLASLFAGVTGATGVAAAVTGTGLSDPGSGAAAVLARSCGAGLVALCPMHVDASADVRGLVVEDASRRSTGRDAPIWSAAGLPAGKYRVLARSGLNLTGVLSVSLGRPDALLQQCALDGAAPGVVACEIDLPAGATALWLTPDPALRRVLESAALQVIQLADASRCGLRARRAISAPTGRLFALDAAAYPERDGVWIAGEQTSQLVASVDNNAQLIVRQGLAGGEVAVRGDGWELKRELHPGEEWAVRLPRRSSADTVIAFAVSAAAGRRPADVDQASSDRRLLGCWVMLR